MANVNFKLQLITTDGKWPFIGNAFVNRNGSISIYLDAGVTVTGGQKLYLRAVRLKDEAAASSETAE
jgi:hypothetical protein